jgi:hypothetical protein
MNALASRITERDRLICHSLYEHPVLTTEQLAELHFNSIERARKRLTQLHQLQLLDRFRPLRSQGSSPYHYLLAQLGAHVVAADRRIEPAQLGFSHAAAVRLASSQQLTHLLGSSGFFTHLAYAARTTGRGQLVTWWGQRRCAQAWGELVRPDGYAHLRLDHTDLEVWVEWDRGTETHARLRDKLDRYQELSVALNRTITLLIVLPSDRREAEVRRRLQAVNDVPVLTSTAARHDVDPLASNWLELAASAERRLTLAQLRSHPAEQPIFSRQDDPDSPADPYGSSAGPQHPDQERSQAHTYP